VEEYTQPSRAELEHGKTSTFSKIEVGVLVVEKYIKKCHIF